MSFEDVMRSLSDISYGLYVVSAPLNGKQNGQIVNTVFQVTSQPPRIAVCINKQNLTHEYISKGAMFGVSVLEQSTPMTFIGLFGFRSGRDVDKFARVEHKMGPAGCPLVLEHALSTLEAKVVEKVNIGTHTLFIGEVVTAEVLKKGEPLTYEYYHKHLKGKTPQNAPTYRGAKQNKGRSGGGKGAMSRYVCDVCGYVYDPEEGDPESGVAPGTAFEDLPEDWVCPVCGAGQDQFSKGK